MAYTNLVDIASTIGTSLKFDATTIASDFGHYARVLIDINLSKPPPDSILLKHDDFSFYVLFEYENLPAFCIVCSSLGHVASTCRSLKPKHNKDHVCHLSKDLQHPKLATK